MPRGINLHNRLAPAIARGLIDQVRAQSRDPRDIVLVAESVLAAVVARCVPEPGQEAVVQVLLQRIPKRVAEIRERNRTRPAAPAN